MSGATLLVADVNTTRPGQKRKRSLSPNRRSAKKIQIGTNFSVPKVPEVMSGAALLVADV
jgi:hypothetical protein